MLRNAAMNFGIVIILGHIYVPEVFLLRTQHVYGVFCNVQNNMSYMNSPFKYKMMMMMLVMIQT
jgi:hypothetical protein